MVDFKIGDKVRLTEECIKENSFNYEYYWKGVLTVKSIDLYKDSKYRYITIVNERGTDGLFLKNELELIEYCNDKFIITYYDEEDYEIIHNSKTYSSYEEALEKLKEFVNDDDWIFNANEEVRILRVVEERVFKVKQIKFLQEKKNDEE